MKFLQAIGNALCATGFGESFAGLIFSQDHSAMAERAVAAAVIVALTLVNAAGVKWVIRSGINHSIGNLCIREATYLIIVAELVLACATAKNDFFFLGCNSLSWLFFWPAPLTLLWVALRIRTQVQSDLNRQTSQWDTISEDHHTTFQI